MGRSGAVSKWCKQYKFAITFFRWIKNPRYLSFGMAYSIRGRLVYHGELLRCNKILRNYGNLVFLCWRSFKIAFQLEFSQWWGHESEWFLGRFQRLSISSRNLFGARQRCWLLDFFQFQWRSGLFLVGLPTFEHWNRQWKQDHW